MSNEIKYTYLDDLEKVEKLNDSDALLLERNNKGFRSTAKTLGDYIVGDIVKEQMESTIAEGTKTAKNEIQEYTNEVISSIPEDYMTLAKTVGEKPDFESGRWTPKLKGSAFSDLETTTAEGYYRKIGNMVYITAYLTTSEDVNATAVTGVPFPMVSENAGQTQGVHVYEDSISTGTVYRAQCVNRSILGFPNVFGEQLRKCIVLSGWYAINK